MIVIYKYNILIQDSFEILLPEYWEFLSVQLQNGKPVMWMKTNTASHHRSFKFSVKGTGHCIDYSDEYMGTFQIGEFVGHLFYKGIV